MANDKTFTTDRETAPPTQASRLRKIATNEAFAGRIGGNQEFTVAADDKDADAILQRQPDAAPLQSLSQSLNLRGFLNFRLWQAALIEGWGTCLLVFIVGATANGLIASGISPFAAALYAALVTFITVTLFTFAGAPVSGGHFNPTITMATFFAGLATLPRSILYITAQSTGAIVGGYWLKLGLGNAYFPTGVIPGCTVDASLVSRGELFVLEYMLSQVLIFTAFGVGLDPRQAKVFGPALGPILVGLLPGLGNLASAFTKPGYTGLSFNSARCLGLMAAKGDTQYHYIHWLAILCAAMLNGIFYYFVPPYEKDKSLLAHLNSSGDV